MLRMVQQKVEMRRELKDLLSCMGMSEIYFQGEGRARVYSLG